MCGASYFRNVIPDSGNERQGEGHKEGGDLKQRWQRWLAQGALAVIHWGVLPQELGRRFCRRARELSAG